MDKLGELVREGANGTRTYRLTEKTSRAFERAIDDEWDSFDYETRLEWMNVAGAYNQQAHAQYGKGTPFRPMSGYEVFCEQWPKVVANQPTSLVLTGDDVCTPTKWNAMPAEVRHLYDEMADDRNAWRFLREHGERETWSYNPFRSTDTAEAWERAAVRIQAAVRGHRARAFPQGRAVKTSDGSVHFYRGPRDRERRFRIERANGNIEHYVPSETHRADGRRCYSEWPNGRIDLYDGPDDNRRCVYSIHPDGCRDHYEGDAGKEVRTRRDWPRGYVQIFGVDGDRQFTKEERWPRSGCRRVYHGKFAIGCTETFGPKSEPEWVFCSRREQLDATTRARKVAWAPHDNGDEADVADAQERERDGRERKRMSIALYKRIVARMSSTNACPKNKRLRAGLKMHTSFMDADAHLNIAGLLRGPPETFDAVFDNLVNQIVIAEKQAQQAKRDPPELASRRAKLLTELKAKCAEPWKEPTRDEPWREPTHDERKRAVALGREVIEALGDLATDEIVAQIAVHCGDGETLEVARATEETLKAAHAAIKAECDERDAERDELEAENAKLKAECDERDAECDELEAENAKLKAENADAQERERLRVALEKRVVARMRQMAIDFGCEDSPTFCSTFSKLVMDRFVRKDIKDLKALVGKDAACFCSTLRAEIETILDVRGPSLEQCADVGLVFDPDFDARKWHRYRAGHILTGIAQRARESRPEPAPPPNRRVESTDGAESADQRRLKAERDAEAAAAELLRSEADERVAAEKKRAEKARKKKEAAQRKAEAGRGAKATKAAQRREQEAARAAERAATVEAKRAAHARALEATKAAHEREEAAKFAQALAAKEAREAEKTEAARAAQREALREHRRAAACSDLVARLDLEDAPPPTPPPRGRATGRGGRGGRGGRAAGRGAGRGAPPVEEDDDHMLCVICMENQKSQVCVPCGHRCLCVVCAAENKPNSCPICRADVAAVVFLKGVFD